MRRDYFNHLGSKSEDDKNEIIHRVKEFLEKPFKEKDSLEIKANRNRVCWQASKREVYNLCSKFSLRIVLKVS